MKKIRLFCFAILICSIFIACKQTAKEIITLTTETNESLKVENLSSSFEFYFGTVFNSIIVILSTFLGSWYSTRNEKRKEKKEIHMNFLKDINNYYIEIHDLFQDLNSYNQLVWFFGLNEYEYDFSKSHKANSDKFIAILSEKNNPRLMMSIAANNHQALWQKLLNLSIHFIDFELIINSAKSLNKSAYINSLFVNKKLKKEFDKLIAHTHDISTDNFSKFYVEEYLDDIKSFLEIAKNAVDKKSNPLDTTTKEN